MRNPRSPSEGDPSRDLQEEITATQVQEPLMEPPGKRPLQELPAEESVSEDSSIPRRLPAGMFSTWAT